MAHILRTHAKSEAHFVVYRPEHFQFSNTLQQLNLTANWNSVGSTTVYIKNILGSARLAGSAVLQLKRSRTETLGEAVKRVGLISSTDATPLTVEPESMTLSQTQPQVPLTILVRRSQNPFYFVGFGFGN